MRGRLERGVERRASAVSSGVGTAGAVGAGFLGRGDNLFQGPEAGQLDVLMGRQEAREAGAQRTEGTM